MKIIDKREDIEETYEDHDVVILTARDGNETLGMIYCIEAEEGKTYLLGLLNDEDKDFGLNIGADSPNELIDNILNDPNGFFAKAKKVNATLIIK